jgi:hypothetical protein
MLGGLGPDEDIPPGPDDIQPHFFDFFGFGQPVALPFSCSPSSKIMGQLSSSILGQCMSCKVQVGVFGLKAKKIRPNKKQ